jgi:methionine synthase I (cobalamin-dependent)
MVAGVQTLLILLLIGLVGCGAGSSEEADPFRVTASGTGPTEVSSPLSTIQSESASTVSATPNLSRPLAVPEDANERDEARALELLVQDWQRTQVGGPTADQQ